MSQQYYHPKRAQQSDPFNRPKDSFRQEESGAYRNYRTLSDRIHLPLEDRLERFHNPENIGHKMDTPQRNNRYATQGDGGGRGRLDERIGGFSEHPRVNGGKQHPRNRREELINYDDKPTMKNFEDRVHDSRTLEERISGATPTSTRRFSYNNVNDGNINKPGNSIPPKQGKKTQNKVQKQNTRNQESAMLTEPQFQEETNGGTIVVRSASSTKPITAPATTTITTTTTTSTAATTSTATTTTPPTIAAIDENGSKQGIPQQAQSIMRHGEVDAQHAKRNLQLEGPSVTTPYTSTPSPVTQEQLQLREKALASIQKRKAMAEAKEKDANISGNQQKATPMETTETGPIEIQSIESFPESFPEKSALTALERSLNSPITKRKVDPERDAAVDAMLAEISFSVTEDRQGPLRTPIGHEDDSKATEKSNVNSTNSAPQPSDPVSEAKTFIPKPIPNIADRKAKGPKEAHSGMQRTPKKELEVVKETDSYVVPSDNQTEPSEDTNIKSEAKQKLTKLPPLQIATSVSQVSLSGRPFYRQDKHGEDDDYGRKEKSGPYSAPLSHPGRRVKDVDDLAEHQSSALDRRPRYWEDRSEIPERDYKRPNDDRRRPDKPTLRIQPKEDYREDAYRNDVNREENRDQFYGAQRLPPLTPHVRSGPPTEDYPYSLDYSYNALRYLPIRGEEHLARQPEYDPYYKDLAEWLEITGFHDIDYRQTALRRHRERELDRLYAMRAAAASAITRGEELASPIDRRALNASALMPPPQVPVRAERGNPDIPVRVPSRMEMYPARPLPLPPPPSTGRTDERPPAARYNDGHRIPSPPPESVGLKRRISQDGQDDGHRPEKASRLTYDTHPRTSSPRLVDEQSEYRSGADSGSGPNHRNLNMKEQDESPSQARHSARSNTPVRDLQERPQARSPSPSRFHENEQRRAAFKETTPYKARITEDEQAGNISFKAGKKPHDKGERRGASPDAPPRNEKGYFRGRGGHNNSGRYQQMGDDHRPPHAHDYDEEFKPTSRGNYGHRRGSFDDSRRRIGHGRGGGDHGRDWYHRAERREKPPMNRTILGSDQMDVDSSGAMSTDTRYFIVKSFNHDNVIHAQRDGIWATQEKNAEMFTEAFNSARDVILIFSVNKSGKFQGYARMESAPGTAEMPSWTKGLLWKSSGAFYIRWITICDVGFYHLAPLLNRLNEDQPVFIGRDGQEIDAETGAKLCSIVDEGRV